METTTNGLFHLDFEVRDYECDLQGVVNNSEYLHYLEHSRHRFLKSIGLDFARLHDEGIDGMVARIEIDYRLPLRSGDRFRSVIALRENGALRLDFLQDIYLLPEGKPVVKAVVTTVCLENGRPIPIRRVFGNITELTAGAQPLRSLSDS